jgi:hypothetical protein
MELILLGLLFSGVLCLVVGVVGIVSGLLMLWYGKYYWKPVTADRVRPGFRQWMSYWGGADWLRRRFHVTIQHKYDITQVSHNRLDGPHGPVIFSCQPHGMLVMSAYLGFLTNTQVRETLRVKQLSIGVHRLLLQTFFLSDALVALGCISVGRESILAALCEGHSVAVMPGGVNEMGPPTVPVVREFGLLKLAYVNKIRLVPVYFEGEGDLCWTWHPKWNWVQAMRGWTRKYTGFPFPTVFMPRFWRSHTLTIKLGQPLYPGDYSSEESFIDAFHRVNDNLLKN